MSTFHPVDLLNYVLESEPSALGILVLNPRIRRVKFRKNQPRAGEAPQRTALVLVELPERVGVNLKGPDAGQDFLIAFSIDRAVYDAFLRRREVEASGLILPPGAKM